MQNPSRKIEAIETNASESATRIESSIIPQSFMLGGLKIDVLRDDNLIQSKRFIGEARYSEQAIVLDPTKFPRQSLEQAYIHELTHWIFYMMNEDELRNNEKLVDLFAHFMYQALATAEPFPPDADQQSDGQGECPMGFFDEVLNAIGKVVNVVMYAAGTITGIALAGTVEFVQVACEKFGEYRARNRNANLALANKPIHRKTRELNDSTSELGRKKARDRSLGRDDHQRLTDLYLQRDRLKQEVWHNNELVMTERIVDGIGVYENLHITVIWI